ncbi:hypothetical protein [Novosphingobium sp. 9]|uniref:hypothetical protein n=1 Tax=Novosphingobium sp. 9 TaxID=2025349 RepID=UPI0021B4DE2B|nr:hypothetical protein [Novosphingobium sp. 9]
MNNARVVLAAVLSVSGLAVMAAPASAQVTAEANVAKSEGQWGGELGVGMPIVNDGPIKVTPMVGVFVYDRDHPGYYKDDGACYANSDDSEVGGHHCDGSGTKLYARIEATYSLPMASVGLGARWMGDDLRPYGTVAVPIAPLFSVKGDLGDHYLAAGITAHF